MDIHEQVSNLRRLYRQQVAEKSIAAHRPSEVPAAVDHHEDLSDFDWSVYQKHEEGQHVPVVPRCTPVGWNQLRGVVRLGLEHKAAGSGAAAARQAKPPGQRLEGHGVNLVGSFIDNNDVQLAHSNDADSISFTSLPREIPVSPPSRDPHDMPGRLHDANTHILAAATAAAAAATSTYTLPLHPGISTGSYFMGSAAAQHFEAERWASLAHQIDPHSGSKRFAGDRSTSNTRQDKYTAGGAPDQQTACAPAGTDTHKHRRVTPSRKEVRAASDAAIKVQRARNLEAEDVHYPNVSSIFPRSCAADFGSALSRPDAAVVAAGQEGDIKGTATDMPGQAEIHDELLRKRVPSASFSNTVYRKPQPTTSTTSSARDVPLTMNLTATSTRHDSTTTKLSLTTEALPATAEALERALEATSRAAPSTLFSKSPRWSEAIQVPHGAALAAFNLQPADDILRPRATSAWISKVQRFSTTPSDPKSTARSAGKQPGDEIHGKENRSRRRPATAGPVAALDFTKIQPGSVVFGRVPLRDQLMSDLEGRRKRRLQEEMDFRDKVHLDAAAEAEQQLQLFARLQHLRETRAKQRATQAQFSACIGTLPGTQLLPDAINTNMGTGTSRSPEIPNTSTSMETTEPGLPGHEDQLLAMDWVDSSSPDPTHFAQTTAALATSASHLTDSIQDGSDLTAAISTSIAEQNPPPEPNASSVDGTVVSTPRSSSPSTVSGDETFDTTADSNAEGLTHKPPVFAQGGEGGSGGGDGDGSGTDGGGGGSRPVGAVGGVVRAVPVFAPRYLLRTTIHVNRLQPSMQNSDPGWAQDLAAVSALVQPRAPSYIIPTATRAIGEGLQIRHTSRMPGPGAYDLSDAALSSFHRPATYFLGSGPDRQLDPTTLAPAAAAQQLSIAAAAAYLSTDVAAAAAVVLPRVRAAVINPPPHPAAVTARHSEIGLAQAHAVPGEVTSVPDLESRSQGEEQSTLTRSEELGNCPGSLHPTAGVTIPSDIRYSLVEARVRGSYLMRQSQKLNIKQSTTADAEPADDGGDGATIHLPAGGEVAERNPWDMDSAIRPHRPSWIISPWPGGLGASGRGRAGDGLNYSRGGADVVFVRPLQELNPQYDIIRPRLHGVPSFAMSIDRQQRASIQIQNDSNPDTATTSHSHRTHRPLVRHPGVGDYDIAAAWQYLQRKIPAVILSLAAARWNLNSPKDDVTSVLVTSHQQDHRVIPFKASGAGRDSGTGRGNEAGRDVFGLQADIVAAEAAEAGQRVVQVLLQGGEAALADLSNAMQWLRPRPPAWGFTPLPSTTRRVSFLPNAPAFYDVDIALVRRRTPSASVQFGLQLPRIGSGNPTVGSDATARLAPGSYNLEYGAVERRPLTFDFSRNLGHGILDTEVCEVDEEGGSEGTDGPPPGQVLNLDVVSAKEVTLPRRARQGFIMSRTFGREVPASGTGDQPGTHTMQQPLPDAGMLDVLRLHIAATDLQAGEGHIARPVAALEAKRGPGLYDAPNQQLMGQPQATFVHQPMYDFSKAVGRNLSTGPSEVLDGDRLVLNPDPVALLARKPSALILPIHQHAPAVSESPNGSQDGHPVGMYDVNLQLVRPSVPRALDFQSMQGRANDMTKPQGPRSTADYHVEDIPLSLLAGFRRPAPGPSFEHMRPHSPPPEGVRDGDRLTLDTSKSTHLTHRSAPRALSLSKQLGHEAPTHMPGEVNPADQELTSWLDYTPDLGATRASLISDLPLDMRRQLARESAAKADPRGQGCAGDLDGGTYRVQMGQVRILRQLGQVHRSAPSIDFSRAGPVSRGNSASAYPDTESGNVLFLDPQPVSGYQPPLQIDSAKQPLGRPLERWQQSGAYLAHLSMGLGPDGDGGGSLLLNHTGDDLARASRVTFPSASVVTFATASKDVQVLQPDPGTGPPRPVFHARVIEQMSTALVQQLPRVNSTLGVMQSLARVQVAQGQARLLNISMGLPQPGRVIRSLVSIPEGPSSMARPQQEVHPVSIAGGALKAKSLHQAPSSDVLQQQQQQQQQEQQQGHSVSIPEAYATVVQMQREQRGQQRGKEEDVIRRAAAQQRRERVVQRVLAQAQGQINAAREV